MSIEWDDIFDESEYEDNARAIERAHEACQQLAVQGVEVYWRELLPPPLPGGDPDAGRKS